MFKKIVIGVILSLSIVLNLFLIDKNKSFDSTNVNLKEKIDELNSENNKLTKELDETKNNLKNANIEIDDLTTLLRVSFCSCVNSSIIKVILRFDSNDLNNSFSNLLSTSLSFMSGYIFCIHILILFLNSSLSFT